MAISDYGIDRIAVSAPTGIVGFAASEWLDTFTILGGSGSGDMIVNWSLDGVLTGVQTSVFLGQLSGTGGSTTQLFRSTGNNVVNTSGSFDVPFTYGVSFVTGLLLQASTNSLGGTADFLNTGRVTSLIIPEGATLTTGSNTTYPSLAVVTPEPASLVLLGSGIFALIARRRRRTAHVLR